MGNNKIDHFTKEAKRKRFVRLATIRTNAILDRLRVLGHCSNRSAYSYSNQDVEKIFSEIEDEVKIIKAKFQAKNKRTISLE